MPMRSLLRRLRRNRPTSPAIWRGIYSSYPGWSSPVSAYRREEAIRAAERLLVETEMEPMPPEAEIDHQILAMLVRSIAVADVSIADFGGGLGVSYAALRRMLPPSIRLRYHVVELDEVVARGSEIWRGDDGIEFTNTLEGLTPSIVYSKGVVQYFADHRAVLRQLFGVRPKWILLEKLPLVTCPTYVTLQTNVYGDDLPYWMFNVAELEPVAISAGYRIALRRRLERVYDQSEFPPELRMGRASSLLFERI
jgi:putative methyltransferase (TIGR04325 family)